MNSAGCPTCGEPGARQCSGCKGIRYCSIECQQADWPLHKVLCKSFKDFSIDSRPSPNMRRVVAFLPTESKPKFMWLPVKIEPGDDGDIETVDTSSFPPFTTLRIMPIKTNSLLGTDLDYLLQLGYDESFLDSYPWATAAVASATNKRASFRWAGPMFAICGKGKGFNGISMASVEDMDLRAYADVLAYFIDYDNDTPEHKARKGPKVSGIKVTCNGERRLYDTDVFSKVLVPRSHPMFESQTSVAPISKLIDLPLHTVKCPTNPTFNQVGDADNQMVTFMNLCCDPNDDGGPSSRTPGSLGWGWAPKAWQRDVGNVLVVRADRKPLDEETVEAFADFCMDKLQPLFEHSLEVAGPEVAPEQRGRARQRVLAEITPTKWKEWIVEVKGRKREYEERFAEAMAADQMGQK